MIDTQEVPKSNTQPGGRARAKPSPKRQRQQEQAYWLHVFCYDSFERVANKLGICRRTASEYVRAEWTRRREELGDDRDLEIRRQVAVCDEEIAWNRKRRDTTLATGRESMYILMASERIAKLKGLDSPVRIKDMTVPPAPRTPLDTFVERAVRQADSQDITALLEWCAENKPNGGNRP
jgi:hypothetical protein